MRIRKITAGSVIYACIYLVFTKIVEEPIMPDRIVTKLYVCDSFRRYDVMKGIPPYTNSSTTQ